MEGAMADKSVSVTACVNSAHHWVIDSPDGPTSLGVCKHCGREKEFNNSSAPDRGGWNSNADLFGQWVPDPNKDKVRNRALSDE